MTDIIQGSEEWFAIRLGKLTASRIADATAKTRTGWGSSRANYMAELIAERLTGIPAIGYTNAAMQWGTEQEPNARAAYEFLTDTDVELLGFMPHPKLVMSGASPDGRVGRGLIEIKCPNTATHIDTLLGAEIDGKYIKQMQWQMACVADASWCDFVSFDPRLPERMRLHITRVMRDNKMIAELESMALDFLRELDTKVDELTKRYGSDRRAAA